MHTVPATEFSKNFGHYREIAQRDPVAVTSHERITGYFVSASTYEEYTHLKELTTKSYALNELSEDTIKAIAASTMSAEHNHLNSLLDE